MRKFKILFLALFFSFLNGQNLNYIVYETDDPALYMFGVQEHLVFDEESAYYFTFFNGETTTWDKDWAFADLKGILKNQKITASPLKFDYTQGFTFQKKYFSEKNKISLVLSHEEILSHNWVIQEEFKEILGFKVQKASLQFRGRSWEVWFAPDLPFSEGPWKLKGLPGLVLEARDKNFHIKAVGIHLNLEEEFPENLAQVFDEEKYTVMPFREVIVGETRFLENSYSAALANMPEGGVPIPKENIREDQLEVEFEWE
ncbi:MAG: GLPGLI family protein [Flavobacteriaceae bacterium]|jgi:GLPGLI family protein|nr:GLPGLI family protein [Flavobacteriaceae bacterium]